MHTHAWSRRSILRLLAVGGASLLSAACGTTPPSSGAPSATGQPATNAQVQPTPAPGKYSGTTVTYWSFFPSDNSRWSERPTMIAQFTQKYGVKVQVDFVQDAQLDTKVQTGFAAKQLPDMIDPFSPEMCIGWGRQGVIIDMKQILVDIGQDDFAKSLINSLSYKGKLYGIPWMANPQLMFYRKDWADAKSLKITNWDDWFVFAKTFTGKNPAGKDGYGMGGFMAPVHQAQWVQDFLGTNNGRTFDESWKLVLATDKANLESVQQMKRLSAFFQPGAVNNNYGDTNNLFTDEVLAIALSSTTFVNGVIKTKPALVDKVGILDIPQGPSGKGDRGAFLGCYSFVITNTSQQKEATQQFISWLLDPANYIQVFRTIDFGHVPVRPSVANDPKLATIVPQLAMDDIKAGINAAQIATLPGQDSGPNPLARQITSQNIWTSMAQKVISGPPDQALSWAAGEIQKIMTDSPQDLG